jgi:hypothetical protein
MFVNATGTERRKFELAIFNKEVIVFYHIGQLYHEL